MTEPRSHWGIFALVGGAVVMGSLNFAAVFVAFGEIREEFAASGDLVSWALTGFSITVAAVMVPAGWLADRLGRKQVFLCGLVLFTLGSLGIALSPNIWILILFRVVQAAGIGMEGPSSLAIILDAFPDNERSTAVGAIGALGALGAALSPVVGGALIESIGWRWAFGASVPIGLITIIVGAAKLPSSRSNQSKGPPDAVGIVMLSSGLGLLVLGIIQSDDWGWGSGRTLGCLVVSALLLTTMVRRSRHHPEPVLELSLFRLRTFSVGTILTVVLASSFAAAYLSLLTLLTAVWGYDTLKAGFLMALIPLIAGPLSLLSGRLADRIGPRKVIAPGAACMAVASLWMYLAAGEDPEIVKLWLPAIGLYGVGVGLAHAATQGSAMRQVPERHLGVGGATTRIIAEVGNSMFVATAILLLASGGGVALDGVRRVFIMLMITSTAGGLAALRFPVVADASMEPATATKTDG